MSFFPQSQGVRRLTWSIFLVTSAGVAAYALGLTFLPEFRWLVSPLAGQLARASPAVALAHFTGGGIALAVGALQFAQRLRLQRPVIHRWLGRIYLLSVLLGGTTGMIMATRSAGGTVARVGFAVLAALWLWTSVQAYRAIRARQIEQHRAWMLRSFSLTFAAVTLRIYLPLSALMGWPFVSSYAVIAWLCWVPNLVMAIGFAPLNPPLEARPRVDAH